MELILAILMGLGIFLVIPVIIGLSSIGIFMLNRRRVLKAEKAKLLSESLNDEKVAAADADNNEPYNTVTDEKKKHHAEVKTV